MKTGAAALLFSLCLLGCGEAAPASDQAAKIAKAVERPPLTSATLEPSGYPTIIYAEPAELGRPVGKRRYVSATADSATLKAIGEGKSAAFYLRIFPVMKRQMEPTIDIGLGGTLQTIDGCLRIKHRHGSERGEGIAVFSPGSRAFVDAQGYLTVAVNYPSRPETFRVGEDLRFGVGGQVDDPKLVAAIRRSCGAGPLFWLKSPRSSYASQLERAAFDALRAAEIHGVTVDVARQKMAAELRAREVHRRRCMLAPDESCGINDGGLFEGSWLMPPPPPPPTATR